MLEKELAQATKLAEQANKKVEQLRKKAGCWIWKISCQSQTGVGGLAEEAQGIKYPAEKSQGSTAREGDTW